MVTLHEGDCREVLRTLGECDAVVTDPPYEIGFMAAEWDRRGVAFDPATWAATLRVLKPGGYLAAVLSDAGEAAIEWLLRRLRKRRGSDA